MNQNYLYFRQVWDRSAALRLARLQDRKDRSWSKRLVAYLWLIAEDVPVNGAAPSLNFRGL